MSPSDADKESEDVVVAVQQEAPVDDNDDGSSSAKADPPSVNDDDEVSVDDDDVDSDKDEEEEEEEKVNGEDSESPSDQDGDVGGGQEEEEEAMDGDFENQDDGDEEAEEVHDKEPTADDSSEKEQGQEDEEENDKKGGEEDDDDDGASSASSSSGSSSDEDSSSDDDDDDAGEEGGMARKSTTTTDDGRELSEYEQLRLERIERNRQYLAKLGLEGNSNNGNNGGGFLGKTNSETKLKRRKKKVVLPPRRSTLDRSSKGKIVKYALTIPTVRELLKGNNGDVDDHHRHDRNSNSDDDNAENDDRKPAAVRRSSDAAASALTATGRPKSQAQRMDLVIHREFLRIRTEKRNVLRQAQKNVKMAEKEVSYWGKRKAAVERAEQRVLQEKSRVEKMRLAREKERQDLGGFTCKELVHQYDSQWSEIYAATAKYDEVFLVAAREKERIAKQVEMEKKMQTIGALERFPKAMRDALSVLNSVFLERAPKDAPPPRRSKRAADEAFESTADGDDAAVAVDYTAGASPPRKKAKKSASSKNASEAKSESPSSCGDDLPSVPVQLAEEEDAEEEEEDIASPNNKKKKNTSSDNNTMQGRRPKRVGGWVQPAFAATIQRTWLNKDTATADTTAFCLAEYVPQVGDAVLYYPIAHAEFLQSYPDVLGKKTRNLTRLPLWERAASERKKGGDDNDDNQPQSSSSPPITKWWTDEWIEGINEDQGKCPILCIVQGTCAEFPPDMKANGTKSLGDKDKASQRGPNAGGKKGPQLRLSVSLRPLTPVVPGPESPALRLAPVFSVVIFPSRLRPFLVPFSWAYTFNHSLTVGQAVHDKSKPKSQLRIGAFDSMAHRLDDHICAIQSVRKRFGEKGLARKFSLVNALSEDSRSSLPVGDALAVLEAFDSFLESRKEEEPYQPAPLDDKGDLLALIGSTLPIWDSVTIVTGARDRTVSVISPWEAQTVGTVDQLTSTSPDKLVQLSSSFDESLRLKIECRLEDQVKQLGDSAVPFMDPITDDDAPNYSCAVPVTMCFSKVFKRLKPKAKGRRSCYYRSVGSVLSDITAIQDNCLLYNNPEAEVVDAVMEVVSTVKDAISQVVRDHNKELCATRKADEERQRLVMLHCATGSTSASDPSRTSLISKPVVVCRVKELYKQQLEQNWLQEVIPAAAGISTNNASTDQIGTWIPQAGDRVLYSREVHTDFVRGHYPSLELEQCYMPPATEPVDVEPQQPREATWRCGMIVWTRATFPKVLSKKSDEDAHTFATASTILAIGVRFEPESTVHVIYWRPVLFGTSDNEGEQPSFFRPDSDYVGKENGDGTGGVQVTTSPISMTKIESDSIDRCFSFLKRRCLAEVSPSYVDSKLTKANVKQGYLPPPTKIGLNTLPTYEDALTANTSGTGHDTRKSNARAKLIDPLLVQCGFVPSWLSEPGPSNSKKGPRFHETVSPWPKLCLELIQLRLQHGYYRHRAAVENDIIEAFSSIVFLLLAEAAGRKNPISIKRIARLLSIGKNKVNVTSTEDGNKDQIATQDDAAALKNEEEWASRLRPIRELYATALVCVSDTKTFECLCGIAPLAAPINPTPINPLICVPQQDPIQVEARKKLALLQAALGRDELRNTFGSINAGYASVPQARLKIICGGKVVSHQRLAVTTTKTVVAVINGNPVRAKIFLSGREFSFKQEELNGEEVDLQTVVAGTVLQSSGPGCTRRVESVVEDTTGFSLDQLERNEALARVFFGRPGRMNPCARCHANMRSMVVCRVLKSHSNPDLDWITTMRAVGGISGLLRGLNPEHNSQVEVAVMADEVIEPTLDTAENEAGEVHDDNGTKDTVDAKETADKALKALSLAREVLVEAQAFHDAPDRMSKEFVQSDVPIDPSDGKKIYCVVCGLSGDLLCCDGCSNVAHQTCVELKDVPEGDWFCEECIRRRSETTDEQEEEEKKDEREKEEHTKNLPFGRIIFDLQRLEGLTSTLQDLRDLHSIRKKRKRDDDGDASDDENGLSDPFMVLSAMTRRFLASIGIRSADELVSSGTTAVGEAFVKWRKEEGMTELKGSGRVASVSMWKRAVKDTAVEMGITLSEDMAPDLGNDDDEEDADDQESQKKSVPSVTAPRKRKTHVVAENSDFDVDEALDVLSDTTKSFLCSEGITTCEQFLTTRTSDLGDLFGAWREQQGLPLLKANGNGASVSGWKAACRKAARDLGWDVDAMEDGVSRKVVEEEAHPRSRRKSQPGPVGKAPSPSTKSSIGKKTAANTPDKRKKVPENVASPRSIRAKRRLNDDGENIDRQQDTGSPRLKRARRPRTTQSMDPDADSFAAVTGDPIGVLDEMPLRFLRSIGIETAEYFLSIKTSDVAKKYGPWREKQGLPTLRGSGDGAHVSAWKSRCRKASKSRGRRSSSSEDLAEKDSATPSRNDLPMEDEVDDEETLPLDNVTHSGTDEVVNEQALSDRSNDSPCPSDFEEEEAPEGPFDIEDHSGMSRARRPPVRFADVDEYKPKASTSGRR